MLSGGITVVGILDGESAPYYFKELFAWSNVESTQNNTTSPFGNDTEPNPAWVNYIPENTGGLAYLWCKQTKYTWNEQTRQYSAGTPQYYRRTGTNGTSINIKGAIDVIVASGDLPTEITGGPSGLKGVIQGSNKIYESVNRYVDIVSWEEYATASDGDSYTIIRDNTLSINGEPAENKKGHLIQWLAEAGIWQDLGLFQGQPGKTYYTHVAWADDVTISDSTRPIPPGQTTRPNASSVTGGSIVQTGNKPWMGIMVDETAQDSTTYTNYTWSEVHANDPIVLDLTNEMDGIQYAGSQKVGSNASTQAVLLKGGVPVDVYDENNNPDGVRFSVATHSGIPNDGYGLSVSGSAATATVNKLSELKGLLVIQAVYQGNVYYKTFTVDKLIDKPKFEISVDKSAISINSTTSPSASESIVVRIWKSVINSSGGVTKSNVMNLEAEGLKLFSQVGSNQPQSQTSNYDGTEQNPGNGSVTIGSIVANVGQVTVWLTDSTGSTASKVTGLIDIETIPVATVQNGAPGANAIRIDIDNQADIVAVDSDGKVRFTRTVIAKARIYNGSNVQTTGVSLPSQASAYMEALAISGVTPVLYHTSIDNANKITGTTTSVTGGVLFVVWTFTKGTQMAVNTAWPATIQLANSSHTYDAAFSLTSSDTAAIYQLLPSVTELAFGVDASTNDFTPSSLGVYCGYKKIDAESETPYAGNVRENLWKPYPSPTIGGTAPYNIFYRTQASNGDWSGWSWAKDLTTEGKIGTVEISANGNVVNVEFVMSSADGTGNISDANIYDHETIPILRSGKKGPKGDDAIVCDLDNDHEDFLYNDAGTKVSGNVTSQAHLYKGATEQTTGVAWAVSCDNGANWVSAGNTYTTGNAKAKISTSGLLTVEELYVDQVTIKVRATYNSNPYYADFTSKKLKQDKYNLVIEPNSIPYNTSETWSNKTVIITADRMSIDGTVVKGIEMQTDNTDIKLAAKYKDRNGASVAWHSVSGVDGTARTLSITSFVVRNNDNILIELRKVNPNATYDKDNPATYTVKDYETIPINRSANGENGSDAWQFDLDVPVLSWNTNSNDRLAQFDTKDVYVRAFKGNVSQGASVSSVTLPLGFVAVLSSGGHVSITPYLQYTSYTNSNVTVYVIGTTPSVGDKAYDSSMIEIGTITDVGSGHIDVGGVRYTNPVTHYTELAEPFTSVVSATADSVSRTVALTITPNKAGAAGQKGDAARQPYEGGTWEAFIADNSNTFTANKYEAPYFIRTEEFEDQNHIKRTGERKWLWVGEDGEYVPPSATPGAGQKRATEPSNSDTNWTLMVTDFKYLISEAVIADYGKMGAGVFSKDYAFSQYGRVDGAGSDIDHYKNFRPEFFKGNAYEMFSGSKTIDSTNYPSSNQPYEFGTLYLESGIDYTFDFTFGSYVGSNIHFDLVRVSDGTKVAQWTGYGTASTASRPYPSPAGSAFPSGDYAIRAYATSGSIIFTRITVTASKAFRPNIYIDWRMGEIFGQKGRFVNVIIEGALNNLLTEINFATGKNVYNKTNNPEGVAIKYDSNLVVNETPLDEVPRQNLYNPPSTITDGEYTIDLLRTGNVIKFTGASTNVVIYMPSRIYVGNDLRYVRPVTLYGTGQPQLMSVEDCRRLSGRTFTIINASNETIQLVFASHVEDWSTDREIVEGDNGVHVLSLTANTMTTITCYDVISRRVISNVGYFDEAICWKWPDSRNMAEAASDWDPEPEP